MTNRYQRSNEAQVQPLLVVLAGPDEWAIKRWHVMNYHPSSTDPRKVIRMLMNLGGWTWTMDKIESYFRNGADTIILSIFGGGPGVAAIIVAFAQAHPECSVEWHSFQLEDKSADIAQPAKGSAKNLWLCEVVRQGQR